MPEIIKTQSEVYFTILKTVQSGLNTNITCEVVNYFANPGSIGKFQYSTDLGASWTNCTQAAVQVESDLNNIPLNARKRRVVLVWESATDLHVLNAFTNVMVKVSFYDRASQAGTESSDVTYTIATVDHRPIETVLKIRPYPSEPNMNFKFKALVSQKAVKYHFRIDVTDQADTDFSNPLYTYLSEADQTGWLLNGAAFPSTGADSATVESALDTIEFSNAVLAALAVNNYNIKIQRSLHDPAGVLMPGIPWE